MAKVIMTLEDKKNGGFSMKFELDPPCDGTGNPKKLTPAQKVGFDLAKNLQAGEPVSLSCHPGNEPGQ